MLGIPPPKHSSVFSLKIYKPNPNTSRSRVYTHANQDRKELLKSPEITPYVRKQRGLGISFKGIQSNFTVEKAGRYRLIQVIKVNITSDGTGCHQFSVDGMQEQSSILKEISPGCSLEELMLKLKL